MTRKITIASLIKEVAENLDETKEARLNEDGSSSKEKAYLKMPSAKPPRRQTNNVTDTREYRNEYQKEYRAENGNGYIPKGPKKKEDD